MQHLNKIILLLIIISLNTFGQVKLNQIEKATGTYSTVTTNTAGYLGFVPEQTLSVNGNSLSISRGNTITLPSSSTTTLTGSTGITITGTAPNYTLSSPNQSLSISGNSVSITNGNTITIPSQTVQVYATDTTKLSKANLNIGYIPKAVSSNSLTNSLIYDDGTDIAIGTTSPSAKLHILQNTIGTSAKGLSVNFNTLGEVFYIDDNGYSKFNGTDFEIKGSNGALNIVSNGGVSPIINFKYANGSSTSGLLYGNGASMFMQTPLFGVGSSFFSPSVALDVDGAIRSSTLTANRLVYSGSNKELESVTLGSNLTFTNGILSATSSGSTTTITAGTNVSITGSAPNYTVSASSPTLVAGTNASITTSGLSYTISTTPTLSINSQSLSISGGNTVTIASPTLTAGSNMSVTTSGLNYTIESVTTPTFTSVSYTDPVTTRTNLKQYDIYLTGGNATTTSSVSADVTGLASTTLTANKRYKISGVIHVGCNNHSGGIKIQITIPSGATMWVDAVGQSGSRTGFLSNTITSSATLVTTAFCTSNTNNGEIIINGEFNIGSTSGVVQFGFASGTNTQTSTIYQLGTHLTLTQIN